MQFLNLVIYIWVFFFYSLRNLTVLIYTDDNKNQITIETLQCTCSCKLIRRCLTKHNYLDLSTTAIRRIHRR